MRGIILAAGQGLRLRTVTEERPKCLARVGGLTLLDRQIQALRGAGIDDVVVVIGCEAERVRRLTGLSPVHFVENARFAQTNSLYSLWLARPLLLEGFVVLNCDVLFHPQILTDLLTARCDSAAVVAFQGDGDALGEEEMKVKIRHGRIRDFSKQLPPDEADGENVGIVKFSERDAPALVAHLDRLVADGRTREWAPRAFAEFARERSLYAVGTRGYPWIEIDFADDYERARSEVLPAIERIPVGFGAMLPFDAAASAITTTSRPRAVDWPDVANAGVLRGAAAANAE